MPPPRSSAAESTIDCAASGDSGDPTMYATADEEEEEEETKDEKMKERTGVRENKQSSASSVHCHAMANCLRNSNSLENHEFSPKCKRGIHCHIDHKKIEEKRFKIVYNISYNQPKKPYLYTPYPRFPRLLLPPPRILL